MSAEQNKALVRRLILEAQQDGKLEVVDEVLAPDFVDHRPLPGLPPTREGVKMLFAGMRAAFPDLKVHIEDQVADQDRVVTRKTFHGTHGGPFMGIPATGRKLELEVIDILKVRDGRITDHWVVVDNLSLLTQLGAMPAHN